MLIRRETLQAVRPATTAEDTRYCLSGIHIEPDGSCVATNGHVLIKASESTPLAPADFPTVPGLPEPLTEPTGPILMPADTADRLCKATPKCTPLEALKTVSLRTNGDGSSYAVVTDLQVPIVVRLERDPTKSFPAYNRIIPGNRETVAVVLGVPVLEALLKSAKAIGATGIRFDLPSDKTCRDKVSNEVNTSITATYRGTDVQAFAVAMPIRL